MRAASSGNVEEVRELIAAGADLNAVDFNHKTALLIASMQGHTEVVSLLTSAGAFLGFILAFHSSDTWAPVGDGAKGIAYARVAADDEILGRDTALAKAQLGTAAALLALARASRFALARARDLGSHDPIGSDDFADLATCLQLAAASLLKRLGKRERDKTLTTADGAMAFRLFLRDDAKVFTFTAVVQGHMRRLWRGPLLESLLNDASAHNALTLLRRIVGYLALLAPQLPLVPLSAIAPGLAKSVHASMARGGGGWDAYLLIDTPLVRLMASYGS